MRVSTAAHAAVVAILVLAAFLSNVSVAQAQAYLQQAKQHIMAKQYGEAIKILEANRPEAQARGAVAAIDNLIGWSYFSLGRLPQAEESLNSALANAERENNARVRSVAANNLGVLHFVEGDLDRALSYFSEPYTRNTKIAAEYRALIEKKRLEVEEERMTQEGISARTDLKFEDAVRSYDQALRLAPDDARILEFKGYSLFRLGKYDEAIDVFQRAIAADTTGSRTFLPLNMIKAYCASGKDELIAPFLRSATVSKETLQSWWGRDRELQEVCAKSASVHDALGQ